MPLSRIEIQLDAIRDKVRKISGYDEDPDLSGYTEEELEDELLISEEDARDIFDQAKNGTDIEDDMTITEDDARDIFDNAANNQGSGH